MRADRGSFTARFVAACRGMGEVLPDGARLVRDPWGAKVLGGAPARAIRRLGALPAPLRALAWAPLLPLLPMTLYMQVRTRAIDDALTDYAREGGRQVVLLGAGFDARARRLGPALPSLRFFEVDHPATRAAREARFGADETRSLAFDFERDPMSALPSRLAAIGHERAEPTFTVWEGVTMYLSRNAFDATLGAIGDYSAPSSGLVFNYIDAAFASRHRAVTASVGAAVRALGEPFTLSLSASEVRDALRDHGFEVVGDDAFDALARRLLPPPWDRAVGLGKRLARAERTSAARRVTR